MLEIFEAYRQVAHVAAWTGLSVGALAACAAAAWFAWEVPLVRRMVIVAAYTVVVAYVCLMHGGAVIRMADTAEWADKISKANLARKQQDAEVEMKVRAEYLPEMSRLQREADERNQRIATYEHTMLGQMAGQCRIGPDAFRLRQPAKAKR